jgi:hypothetical protein
MTKTFRLLVLLSLGLYVLWFYFPYLDPFLFDEERLAVWGYSGFDTKFEFPHWHYYLWLAFWTVVTYGLYNFAKWSRDVLIVGYIVGYFLAPIYGTAIQSPLSSVLGNLSTLLDGIIIGMAYFSPLAERFARTTTGDAPKQ